MWHNVVAAAQEAVQVTGSTPSSSGGTSSASSGNPQLVQILLTILGPAGILGSIIALLRFKSEDSSQVFTQHQGVTAEWKEIADSRKQEIAELEAEVAVLRGEIKTLEAEHSRKVRQLETEIGELRRQVLGLGPTS